MPGEPNRRLGQDTSRRPNRHVCPPPATNPGSARHYPRPARHEVRPGPAPATRPHAHAHAVGATARPGPPENAHPPPPSVDHGEDPLSAHVKGGLLHDQRRARTHHGPSGPEVITSTRGVLALPGMHAWATEYGPGQGTPHGGGRGVEVGRQGADDGAEGRGGAGCDRTCAVRVSPGASATWRARKPEAAGAGTGTRGRAENGARKWNDPWATSTLPRYTIGRRGPDGPAPGAHGSGDYSLLPATEPANAGVTPKSCDEQGC